MRPGLSRLRVPSDAPRRAYEALGRRALDEQGGARRSGQPGDVRVHACSRRGAVDRGCHRRRA
jgi:hypothetical protein